MLVDELLQDFSVRVTGLSVNQSGDPVPRFVLHCRRHQPTIVVVSGKPDAGKSALAAEFRKGGFRVLHTDQMLGAMKSAGLKDPFIAYAKEKIDANVAKFMMQVVRDNRIDEFCTAMLRYVSKDQRVTIIEGYAFSLSEIYDAFTARAKKAGYRVANIQL